MSYRKKLIEVALPLDAINNGCRQEKNPFLKGHPRSLHLWWARRPLAAARAVIFAQMVDDPSTYIETLSGDKKLMRKAKSILNKRHKVWEEAVETVKIAQEAGASVPEPGPEPTLDEILAELERDRLFRIIEDLVQWENTNNETVLQKARDEILQSWRRTCAEYADHPKANELFDRHKLPAFHDPFAGGGSLPLEAQRLGLEAYASELNPVAVLINKAMIEIPPKFAGQPPVNPEAREDNTLFERSWKGAEGLAEDVRYYGKWMRDEAEKRIGHLYPRVKITEDMVNDPDNPRPDLKQYIGQSLTVIAWLWARTVKSPNPVLEGKHVPLVRSFWLSTKKHKEAWVEPIVDQLSKSYSFKVRTSKSYPNSNPPEGIMSRQGGRCLISGVPITYQHIRSEAKEGRMQQQLMAIVLEGDRGRIYISPTTDHIKTAELAKPNWRPDIQMPLKHRNFQPPVYGMFEIGDLFTARQIVALTTFSDLLSEVRNQVKKDACLINLMDDGKRLNDSGSKATAYIDSIALYLACGISQISRYSCSICSWNKTNENVAQAFGRQAIPMVWDYAESNPLHGPLSIDITVSWVANAINSSTVFKPGFVFQYDARRQNLSSGKIVSTDPPYYDNICYADLSDFFYAWLRLSVKSIFPELFATLAVPKAEELIAATNRHESKKHAESYFLEGMTQAMQRLSEHIHPFFPVTIYYAFKQSESESALGVASTGWEAFLDAVNCAKLSITGTWPMRTERDQGLKTDKNALASCIVLVCRKRDPNAPASTRREFINNLKSELPKALVYLQRSNIAPVDLAQAAIGPGMAVYTRYSKVLDAEGNQVTVREALALINQILDEVLAEQEGEFDSDTRWALAWFEQYGFSEGEYGVAETLSTAKNTSVAGMVDAGIIYSKAGKVRLLKPEELPEDWDPDSERRLTVWEMVHHLIRVLEKGETLAAELIAKLGGKAESARELAYRLYVICERKKWANEALAYNSLVQSWPEMETLVQAIDREEQQSLFEEG